MSEGSSAASWQALYQSTLASLREMTTQRARAAAAHGALRRGVIVAMQQAWPREVVALAQRGDPVEAMDDATLLDTFSFFLTRPAPTSAPAGPAPSLSTPSAATDATGPSAAPAAAVSAVPSGSDAGAGSGPPTTPTAAGPRDVPLPDGPPDEEDVSWGTMWDTSVPPPDPGPDVVSARPVPPREQAVVDPVVDELADLFSPVVDAPPAASVDRQDASDVVAAPEVSPPAAVRDGTETPHTAPATTPAPARVDTEPTGAGDPPVADVRVAPALKPDSAPRPSRRSKARKPIRTRAEQAGDPLAAPGSPAAALAEAVSVARPVFLSDLTGVADPDTISRWVADLKRNQAAAPVRTVAGTKTHSQGRGLLLTPWAAMEDPSSAVSSSWWAEAVVRYKAHTLYAVAVMLHGVASHVVAHDFGDDLAVVRTNTQRGLQAVALLLSDDVTAGSTADRALGGLLEQLQRERLDVAAVLTRTPADVDALSGCVGRHLAALSWTPGFDLVTTTVADWAGGRPTTTSLL